MKTIKRNRKLRAVVCAATIISLLSSNIAPAAAMAVEIHNGQVVWQEVLNADLTEYQGKANPRPFGSPPSEEAMSTT